MKTNIDGANSEQTAPKRRRRKDGHKKRPEQINHLVAVIAFPEDPLILRPSLLLLATARRLAAWAAAARRNTPRLARSVVVHAC